MALEYKNEIRRLLPLASAETDLSKIKLFWDDFADEDANGVGTRRIEQFIRAKVASSVIAPIDDILFEDAKTGRHLNNGSILSIKKTLDASGVGDYLLARFWRIVGTAFATVVLFHLAAWFGAAWAGAILSLVPIFVVLIKDMRAYDDDRYKAYLADALSEAKDTLKNFVNDQHSAMSEYASDTDDVSIQNLARNTLNLASALIVGNVSRRAAQFLDVQARSVESKYDRKGVSAFVLNTRNSVFSLWLTGVIVVGWLCAMVLPPIAYGTSVSMWMIVHAVILTVVVAALGRWYQSTFRKMRQMTRYALLSFFSEGKAMNVAELGQVPLRHGAKPDTPTAKWRKEQKIPDGMSDEDIFTSFPGGAEPGSSKWGEKLLTGDVNATSVPAVIKRFVKLLAGVNQLRTQPVTNLKGKARKTTKVAPPVMTRSHTTSAMPRTRRGVWQP